MIPDPKTTPISPTEKETKLSFQEIISCKEGTASALKKVLEINPTADQLQKVSEYQKQCLALFTRAQQEISEQGNSKVNNLLLEALDKSSNRVKLDNQIIKKFQDSFQSNNGVALIEEVLGFQFAGKMILEQESRSWMEYKKALETTGKETPTNGGGDWLGMGFLILIIGLVAWRYYRLYLRPKEPKTPVG